MKTKDGLKTLSTPIVTLWLFLLATVFAQTSQAADKPNIVLFFTDDMGYGDIGPFGSTTHETPHLDRMAKEGIKFTDFYVSSTACTPSRSALMTGCYADRIGMGASVVFPGDKRGLNPSEITIAEMLKTKGYVTGCFGKWHLGDQPDFMPLKQGFDEYEGIPYSNDMWSEVGRQGRKKHPPLPYIKQDKVVAYIPDRNSQAVLCDAVTDAEVPSDRIIDGKDILDILLGKEGAKSPHDTLYYEVDGIRQGKWKFVRYGRGGRTQELYNLDDDLGEENNLAGQFPEKVKTMQAKLDKHKQSIKANVRPAAFVEDPKPILADPGELPTLFEYRKGSNTKAH